MYKINFIYHRIKHHSPHAGYDSLTHYLQGNDVNGKVPIWISWLLPNRLIEKAVTNSHIEWYKKHHFLSEVNVSLKFFSAKKEIFHFLYGEDAYCYTGFMPRYKNKKIISTFHQPPNYFGRYIERRNHLDKLDAIIVVSESQIPFFENIVGKEKIFFVPHGIDTEFFIPSQNRDRNESHTCLFVGQWLRDFEMLRGVIQIVNNKNKEIKFKIITAKEYSSYFEGLTNVEVHHDISDYELLNYYQRASLVVLPLLDCTANNSILEALSCQLPVITTDVGGVRDYLDESCAALVQSKDVEGMAKKILELIENRPLRKIMGQNARKKVLGFGWPIIVEKLQSIYRNLYS